MEIFDLPKKSQNYHTIGKINHNSSGSGYDIPWLKWDHIHPMVLQSLLENGFKAPTEVQSYTLSTFKHYNDFVVSSQTGSGKTLSFGIPILSEILHEKQGKFRLNEEQAERAKQQYVRALFVAPTRELALQIEKNMKQINQKTEHLVRIVSLVGGISKDKQKRLLSYKPDILICTPGRLWDFIEEENHPYLQNLNKIDYFVMDEADRMIEMGHFDDIDKILQTVFHKKIKTHGKEMIQKLTQNENPDVRVRPNKHIEGMSANERALMEGGIIEMDEDEFLKTQKQKKVYNVEELDVQVSKEEMERENNKDIKKKKGKKGKKQGDSDEEDDGNIEEEDDGIDPQLKKLQQQILAQQKQQQSDDEEDQPMIQEMDDEDDDEDDEQLSQEEQSQDDDDEDEDDEDDQEDDEDDEQDELQDQELNEEELQELLKQQEGEEIEDEEEEEVEEEEEDEERNLEDELFQDKTLKKKNTKIKVFLVSATILQHFKGNQKFKITKKELKKNKDKAKKAEEKNEKQEQFNIKIQALLQKLKFSGKPKIIDLTSRTLFPEKLKEYKTLMEEDDKILYLYHFIQQNIDQNFIVFCNSISYCKKVTHLLEVLKLNPVLLHSDQQQRQRLKKLDKFKENKSNILICTDVAARGLDIPKVQNVVHYQVPMDIDTYVHRSGRTARIGQDGSSYVFIGPQDAKRYNQLCKQLGKNEGLQGLDISMTERQKIKDLIDEAVAFEKKQYQLRKKQSDSIWYKKISKDADIELDEELKKEMADAEGEVVKKRVVAVEQKNKFNQAAKDVKNIDRSRRNALFLDPSQIHSYMQKIDRVKQKVKDQKQRAEERKQAKMDDVKNQNQNRKDDKKKEKKNKKKTFQQRKAEKLAKKQKKILGQDDDE